ncbi:MAG TPA: tryptophanase [Actinomycetota bacterium]|nr:tryptophanase [Actinomycetota bacterium]
MDLSERFAAPHPEAGTQRLEDGIIEAWNTIIEPFRIKSVEPLRFTTEPEREAALARAGYNLFGLRSEEVLIDLLSDSGTGAMSADQWGELMRGDEAYAGSSSFEVFASTVGELTGLPHVIPVHQGRAAERILFAESVTPGAIVPNNTHFDTTRANIEHDGGIATDLPVTDADDTQSEFPFKGNMDIEALEKVLREHRDRIPMVFITVTNNSVGGQPVSMANVRAVRELCDRYELPLFIDAARFAENCWFVIQREEGYADRTPREVAKELFSYADGVTMSAKKDALVNIGGFLALKDDELAARCRALLILTEGFPTYGGLAGRDLLAIAQGLNEVLEPEYLQYRVRSVEYLAELCRQAGVPTVRPPGGHAVYLDAGALLPHIPRQGFPAQALAVELYRVGGLRGVEVGSVMFADAAHHELVRLALPRRVYTQSHIDYVGEVIAATSKRREQIPGYAIEWEPPFLRHFTARFKPFT